MRFRKILGLAIAGAILLPTLPSLGGCAASEEIVLRVYNWEEYIDEGGEGAFIYDELHLEDESYIVNDDFTDWYEETMGEKLDVEGPTVLDDFCLWYEKEYGQPIRVEYSTFGTNEDMYNEIVLGNEYDLLCPSDYMIMKLAAEGRLEKYDESFFNEADPNNYYVRNVSPFIREKFENNAGLEIRTDDEGEPILWRDYAAGYMWGTTGFVYNPEHVTSEDLERLGWEIYTDSLYSGKITAKDNVRDTYFAALGVTYQNELLSLKHRFEQGSLSQADYVYEVTRIFNATDEETVSEVEPVLMAIKNNIYSFETDTGKSDMVKGNVYLNYAWSGDAVYALDLGEDSEDGEGYVELNYYVPEAGSNLWFDGWVMPKGANKQAAQAFVNFMSMPYNAMRNSYYIGYTSVISGENCEMLDYADYLYGYYPEEEFEEGEEYEEAVDYDLTYFFLGENYDESEEPITIPADPVQATCRQLYAQFPPREVIARSAVMDYYDVEANERINELWSRVKAESLDAWAIIVLCVTAVAIVFGVVFIKFGDKIDLLHPKPKKGYRLVKQEEVNDKGA
ncbi:MAG: extracellular solute-binding protein [Clostridia bacterium]|nr:extracellular solute-binding protein [Clostridia bacterium]